MSIAPMFLTIFGNLVEGGLVPSLLRLAGRGLRLKAASAQLDYPIEWTLNAGETIATSGWVVAPVEVGGLAVVPGSGVVDELVTACMVSGGVYRRVYELTNTITTSGGRLLVKTIGLRIGPEEAS